MATFDDMAVEGKLTVYDKGFDESVETYGEYITRSGDIWSPMVPNAEPLRLECEHFLECVREGTAPLSDGESGLRVVRVLELLQARPGRVSAGLTGATPRWRAATTSAACAASSTGLIGIARCVRAASSVPGSVDGRARTRASPAAVHRRAVVGLLPVARGGQRARRARRRCSLRTT